MKLAIEWESAAKAGRAACLTESQCRRVISEIHELANGSPLHFQTCSTWLDEWLAGKKGSTAPRTFLKYEQVIEEFTDHLAERARLPLPAISVRDVRQFRDALAKEGHSPATVNQTVKVLSGPFLAALRLGYITVNPCANVEALRDDGDTQKDTFTVEQVQLLLNATEGDWYGVILAGFFTGLRLRDVTELRWESIDLEAGLLRTRTRKTGTLIVLPLHSEFKAWLSKQTRGIGKAPVFPKLAGKSGAGKSGLSSQFKRIMERAGIKGRVLRQTTANSAGRTQSSLTFHSLRHSFNSALANAGVAQEVRRKLTGHASAAMNDVYTQLEIETLRAAVIALPSLSAVVR